MVSYFSNSGDAWPLVSTKFKVESDMSIGIPFCAGSEGLQICSPIIDISTWAPHCEHLMVGSNTDSLPSVAMVMIRV